MDFTQLSEAFPLLDETSKSIYMKRIAVAYEPEGMEYTKELLKQLAPDHEIQLLTDGTPENTYAIGIGAEDKVNLAAEDRSQLREIYTQMRIQSSKPIYLIHNHPATSDSFDTLPSPEDIEYFATLPSGLIPAIYTNRTGNLLAYPYDA